CWSEPLGYPCCSNKDTKIVNSDKNGDWGVENKKWCGICWSESLGYPCCSENIPTSLTDENGDWGFENENWCGI
ncbi:Non-catalytic module family DOC2, partial [Piromyces sp. E2]